VDPADDVGAGGVQDLVAALETVEVGQGQFVALQHRAHRPVRDHHTLGQHGSKIMRHQLRIVPQPHGCGGITTMWRRQRPVAVKRPTTVSGMFAMVSDA
jgi:hypothetical protein